MPMKISCLSRKKLDPQNGSFPASSTAAGVKFLFAQACQSSTASSARCRAWCAFGIMKRGVLRSNPIMFLSMAQISLTKFGSLCDRAGPAIESTVAAVRLDLKMSRKSGICAHCCPASKDHRRFVIWENSLVNRADCPGPKRSRCWDIRTWNSTRLRCCTSLPAIVLGLLPGRIILVVCFYCSLGKKKRIFKDKSLNEQGRFSPLSEQAQEVLCPLDNIKVLAKCPESDRLTFPEGMIAGVIFSNWSNISSSDIRM